MVATAFMKLASEARPSQYTVCNTEPTCMPLSGHFMHIGAGF